MEIKRIAAQIFTAGYLPYYDKESLYIFQNQRSGGLQFYSAKFKPWNGQQTSQVVFTRIEGMRNLLKVKHLMPEDMQRNLMAAAKLQGICEEVQEVG